MCVLAYGLVVLAVLACGGDERDPRRARGWTSERLQTRSAPRSATIRAPGRSVERCADITHQAGRWCSLGTSRRLRLP